MALLQHWLALEALEEIVSAAAACEAAARANHETGNVRAELIEREKARAYRNAARAITDRLDRERYG